MGSGKEGGMAPLHFNMIAIVVAAIINFALGGLWYAQPVFGRYWVAAIGKRPGVSALAASGGTSLPAAILLAVVIGWTRASTVGDGLLVAGIGWLAFAWTGGAAAIFERSEAASSSSRGIEIAGLLDDGRDHRRLEVTEAA